MRSHMILRVNTRNERDGPNRWRPSRFVVHPDRTYIIVTLISKGQMSTAKCKPRWRLRNTRMSNQKFLNILNCVPDFWSEILKAELYKSRCLKLKLDMSGCGKKCVVRAALPSKNGAVQLGGVMWCTRATSWCQTAPPKPAVSNAHSPPKKYPQSSSPSPVYTQIRSISSKRFIILHFHVLLPTWQRLFLFGYSIQQQIYALPALRWHAHTHTPTADGAWKDNSQP